MRRAAVSGALLLVGLSAGAFSGACSLVATFDDRPSHDGGSASQRDGASSGDASSGDGGSPGSNVYANGCGGHAGPEPVKAVGFCIDSTEVTNAQYAEFIDATKGAPATQSPTCTWNTTFVPESGWPADAAKATFPVNEVDWCDAYAYCAWAGKHLCGKIGGGPSPVEDGARVTDEWYLACSMAGTRLYPYGATFGDDTCNGSDHNVKHALGVGTMPKCEGGFAGLFDMSGNVTEWEDSCSGAAGATDQCFIRGGGFESSQSKMGCPALVLEVRASAHSDVGFRCCSSP